jgi:hypothetical protein
MVHNIYPSAQLLLDCHPIDPIFHPYPKLFIGKFIIPLKFCLPLKPNGIVSSIRISQYLSSIQTKYNIAVSKAGLWEQPAFIIKHHTYKYIYIRTRLE